MSRLVQSVLIIDEEPQTHRLVAPALRAAGYGVLQAMTAADGLLMARSKTPQAVLLDVDMPDMEGTELLARLREVTDVPLLVISARDREADKIRALDEGADDYLEKPFGVGELLARLRAIFRRRQGDVAPRLLKFPGLTIDLQRRLAVVVGKPVIMTPREWSLLVKLAQHSGRVITHRQLLTSVWGTTHAGDLQYLRVYIASLRQKLGESAGLITTEVGVGYRMAERLRGD